MAKRITDSATIRDFTATAEKFCHLVESRDEQSIVDFLQGAYKLMPLLCLHGMNLPVPMRFGECETRLSGQEWSEIFLSIGTKLGKYEHYSEVYDPYGEADAGQVGGNLADDLSDIYRDLKSGMRAWDAADAAQRRFIVWEWGFLYEVHWGEHATGAFRAIHSLLYDHIKDKDGDRAGLRRGKGAAIGGRDD